VTTLPRLRRVNVLALEWEARTVVCVRDPDGVLDEQGLLESPRYRQRRAVMESAYRAAPLRPPHHAGRSYPHDGEDLRGTLEEFMASVDRDSLAGVRPRGGVAPHIDLPRGGAAYAWTHAAIEGATADTWIVLGVAHGGPPSPFALTRKVFSTPLGAVPIDADVASAIAASAPDAAAHEMAHRTEHSVEFQALFLRLASEKRPLRIAPVLCSSFESWAGAGSPRDVEAVERTIQTLRDVISRSNGRVGVLASVDFSHVGPCFGDEDSVTEQTARATQAADEAVLRQIVAGDAEAFWKAVTGDGNPRRIDAASAAYTALRALAPVRGRLLRYQQAPDPAGGLVSFASLILE
jgi:AmmeMemoRadiSam system protein B